MFMKNPFRSEFLLEMNGKRGLNLTERGGLIWYTDGSKTNKGTGPGVYCYETRRRLSFSLGQYTMVFQAEVYAIKACADENIDRNYKNRNYKNRTIYILSDSQAANQALDKYREFTGRGNGSCSAQWKERFSETTVPFTTSESAAVR
jgi:hypothetical protein